MGEWEEGKWVSPIPEGEGLKAMALCPSVGVKSSEPPNMYSVS